MLTAEEVIAHAKSLTTPNAGVIALARQGDCIMDEPCCRYPYKDESGCRDYNRCDDETYLLACLATRDVDQLADWAVETYSNAVAAL